MLSALLAVLAAFASGLASVLQRKEARDRPASESLSWRLLWHLVRRPVWLAGIACLTAGFLLQAVALGLGRISVVESLLVLDLPVALVFSPLILHGRHLRAREWAAVAAMVGGLAGLLLSLSPSGGTGASVSGVTWALAVGANALLVLACVLWARSMPEGTRKAAVLGVAVGCGFGMTAALVKGASAASGIGGLFTRWQLYAVIITGAGSLFLLQSAVRAGRLLAAQPGLSLGDPVISILWGSLVFRETMRGGWLIVAAAASAALVGGAVVVLARSPLLADDQDEPDEQDEPESGRRDRPGERARRSGRSSRSRRKDTADAPGPRRAVAAGWTRWWQAVRRHAAVPYVQRRAHEIAGVLIAAAVLDLAAAFGLARVAGFRVLRHTLAHFEPLWLIAAAAGLAVSFAGFAASCRVIYRAEGGPDPGRRRMTAVTVVGHGGLLAHGRGGLDRDTLRAAGASDREARMRANVLAGMELAVLGYLGTAVSVAVLVLGLTAPPTDFTLPWAVIPIPATAAALAFTAWLRPRLRTGSRRQESLAMLLDSALVIRTLLLRPRKYGVAVLGMLVFWLGEAFSVWAAVAAFGFLMDWAALAVGFATGMLFSRRVGPLAGAGLLMVVLPFTLWHSGAPVAMAVAAVFVYRALSLWLPFPFALVYLPELRRLKPYRTQRS
ncbi:DMT family transporter [Actinospica sp. MGRD01-02]|uniref:DMT family transporter n=1 Tax=Actinospica acidithermotolerans TaxID=2828514 RepID=A0A941EC17_9ACTN|nr:DMT family transporter [Actinospica acidithermotolerans]MBR7825109.1 DMT family transporter [Actinospica acidithermotolerans]